MWLRRLLIWNFRVVQRWSDWLRKRFSLAGRVTLTLTIFAGALGVDTRQTPLHQGAALLAAALLVAMLNAWFFRGKVRAERHLPRYATAGVPFTYQVTLENRGRRRQRGLLVRDELETGRVDAETYQRFSDTGAGEGNWFDRRVGYPRWAWLVRRQTGASLEEAALHDLPARSTARAEITATPLRRGYLRFSRIGIARPDPLGLHRAFIHVAAAQRLLVLPRQYPVALVARAGRRRFQPGGVALAAQVGDAQEFTSVREYRSGDSPRRMHWKSFARVGYPVVKQYQDEYLVRHAVALDTCMDRIGWRVFETAVSVAASFVNADRPRDSMLDLLFVADQVHQVSTGRGSNAADRLLELLANVDAVADARFDAFADSLTEQQARMSNCILVLLTWDEKRRSLARALAGTGLSVQVFLVLDKDAAAPPKPDLGLDSFITVNPDNVAERLGRA